MAGGSNTGTLRNGEPQASARGGRIGTLPTKNLRLLLGADRPADHHLHALAVDLLGVLRGRYHRSKRHHLQLRIAALDLERGKSRHVAQQGREVVALNVGNMVGLGGGEQHLVDVRAEQQLRDDSAVAVAEALQDGIDGAPGILERLASGQQRAQHIDQHDLTAYSAGSDPGRTGSPLRACRLRSDPPSALRANEEQWCLFPLRRRAARTRDREHLPACQGTGIGRAAGSSGRTGRAP